MKRRTHILLAVGLFGMVGLTVPGVLAAQRSGVEIWSQNCGRCHLIQPANRYTADQWESIMAAMQIQARLTDQEAEAILEFLKSGAKRTASLEPDPSPTVLARLASSAEIYFVGKDSGPAELFSRQCAACHGNSGEGNGPAASALSPKPTDFTKPAFQEARTDEQLSAVITDGKGIMPSFGKQLAPGEIAALVTYIRELGAQEPR